MLRVPQTMGVMQGTITNAVIHLLSICQSSYTFEFKYHITKGKILCELSFCKKFLIRIDDWQFMNAHKPK